MLHALRHTFATDALQAGADVVELQALVGHASLDTTRRYLDATAEGLRDGIKGHPARSPYATTSITTRATPANGRSGPLAALDRPTRLVG